MSGPAAGDVSGEWRYDSLDEFEVMNFLGGGAFGKVYKAKHILSGEICVIKEILLSDLHMNGSDDKHIKQCLEEAKFLMRNKHPYIIGFKGQFKIEGTVRQLTTDISKTHGLEMTGELKAGVKRLTAICIIMEFAAGGDLDIVIKKTRNAGSRIPENAVWAYFVNLILGIGHLHINKVIHRDIKPANVLLDSKGQLKIGDLGLGRDISNQTNGFANTVKGTYYYMCPEMLHGKPYDCRCDMWSMGCLLYEMLTLDRPFTGKTEFELMKHIVRDEPNNIESLHDHYTWRLYKLTRWLLQKDPLDRPTALEVWAHLLREEWIPPGVVYNKNAVPWTDAQIAAAHKDCSTMHSLGLSPMDEEGKRLFDEGKRTCHSIFISGSSSRRKLTPEEIEEHKRCEREGRMVPITSDPWTPPPRTPDTRGSGSSGAQRASTKGSKSTEGSRRNVVADSFEASSPATAPVSHVRDVLSTSNGSADNCSSGGRQERLLRIPCSPSSTPPGSQSPVQSRSHQVIQKERGIGRGSGEDDKNQWTHMDGGTKEGQNRVRGPGHVDTLYESLTSSGSEKSANAPVASLTGSGRQTSRSEGKSPVRPASASSLPVPRVKSGVDWTSNSKDMVVAKGITDGVAWATSVPTPRTESVDEWERLRDEAIERALSGELSRKMADLVRLSERAVGRRCSPPPQELKPAATSSEDNVGQATAASEDDRKGSSGKDVRRSLFGSSPGSTGTMASSSGSSGGLPVVPPNGPEQGSPLRPGPKSRPWR